MIHISHFQDVVWPTVTVCNLNQVEASFMKDVEVYGDMVLTDLLINEFILGRVGNLSEQHENAPIFFQMVFIISVFFKFNRYIHGKKVQEICREITIANK